MTIELRNTIKGTRQATFFITRLGYHWETSAQYPNFHGEKDTVKRTKSLPEKTMNKLIPI